MPGNRARRSVVTTARTLRHSLTPAEAKLWARLRARQVNELRFRRQQPIGCYVVDFYCSSCRLVIELDGDSHVDRSAYDEARTQWLRERGYRVLRFDNSDVDQNMNGVLERILSECVG